MAYAKIAEQSEQSKKITRILIAVLVAIILAIACLALAPTVLAMTVREYRVISGVSEPVQTAVKTGVLRLSGDTWSGADFTFASSNFVADKASYPAGGGEPEPTSGLLMLVGLGVLGLRRKRK